MIRLFISAFLSGLAFLDLVHADSINAAAAASDTLQLGHGLNLAEEVEFTKPGGNANHGLTDADFDRIAGIGFTLVRLPIDWAKHAGPAPDYTIDPAFFARVDWIVSEVKKHHLQAVLDYQKDDNLMLDPAANTDRYVASWKQIAAHYKDAPPTIVFELMNEPHKKLNESWNDVLLKGLAAVRSTNPTRAVLIGPVEFNQVKRLPDLVLPEDDRRLIVEFHYYDPMKFTHQGASWIPGSSAWLGTTWDGTDAEKKTITDAFDAAAKWGIDHHRPIYLGEFGSTRKADPGSRLRWTRLIVATAKAHDFPWTYWDYHGNFGVWDREAKQWRQPLLDALLQK